MITTYKTNRGQRLNTVGGAISGTWLPHALIDPIVPGRFDGASALNDCAFLINLNPGGVYSPFVQAYGTLLASPGSDGYPFTPVWTLVVDPGFGVPAEQILLPIRWHYDHVLNVGGSYSITFWTEEFVDIGSPADLFPATQTVDGNGFPEYSAPMGYDSPSGLAYRFYEKLVVGKDVTVSLTSGGQTQPTHHTVLAGQDSEVAYNVAHTLYNANGYDPTSYGAPYYGVASITAAATAWNGVAMYAPYTFTQGGATADVTSGPSVSIAAPGMSGNQATLTATLYALKQFNLNFQAQALGDAYPGNVGFTIRDKAGHNSLFSVTDGNGTFSGTQNNFDISCSCNSTAGPHSVVDEWSELYSYLTPSWLLSSGEDTSNWRTMFRGYWYNTFTMTQSANTSPDGSPSTTNWSADNAHTILSPAMGGGVQAVVDNSGQTGSFSRPFPDAVSGGWYGTSFQGYRYLRLYLTADMNNQAATITLINPDPLGTITKSWNVTVNQTGYIDIDLCDPSSVSAYTDGKDTRYPLSARSVSTMPRAVHDGPYYGVSNCTKITISNLTTQRTYTLTSVQLVRKDHTKVSFLPAYNNWVNSHDPDSYIPGDIPSEYRTMFLTGDTDGRLSLEARDFFRQQNPPSSPTYTIRQLTDLANDLIGNEAGDQNEGWSVTQNTFSITYCGSISVLYDCYLNNSLPAVNAMGGGLRCTKEGTETTASWKTALNLDASSSLQVIAQVLLDTLDWYPGCIDPFGFLPSGTNQAAIELRAGKILRGAAWGLVVIDDKTLWEGANIGVTDVSLGSNSGTAVTDSLGEYQTGGPYGRGNHQHMIAVEEDTYVSLTKTFYAARLHRACFRPPCKDIMGANPVYFPFAPQWGDSQILALEEWRHIPPPVQDTDKQNG